MCMNKSCSTGGKILLSLLFSNLLLLGLLLPKVFPLKKKTFSLFYDLLLKISIRKKELFYKTIHAKTVVVLYRVILREFLRPAKLPVSFTERISVSGIIIASIFYRNAMFTFLTKFRLTSGIPIRGVLRSPPLLC